MDRKNIIISKFPDKRDMFCGFFLPEPCTCCGKDDKDTMHVLHINDDRLILCEDCLVDLYREIGYHFHESVKLNDTVWELVKCDDETWRIFPMVVKFIAPYGSIRQVKGEEPTIWNIYAESDYTYMYKSFYDAGKTLFFTEEDAKAALSEITFRKIEAGKCYMFNTTDSELKKYNGTKVTVLRSLTNEECDIEDVGRMYKIRFDNGVEHDAFEDELSME